MSPDTNKLVKMVGLVFVLMLFVGCIKQPCPSQDLTFIATFEDGWRPISLEKGFFDDKETWLDKDQWEKIVEKYNVYLQEQRELEYQRRFGD